MPCPLSSASISIPASSSNVQGERIISPWPAWGGDIVRRLGHDNAELPLPQFVEIHRSRKRKSLPASIAGLAGIGWADWNDSTEERHYFHRMAVMVVPLPGLVSISNSFIRRLLPPSPNPIPLPDVYPSFSASATSGIPGP